jgi:Flp pilus assembly pilin Flp
MLKSLARFWRDERGQDLVEYALLLGGVAIMVVAAAVTLTDTMSTLWTTTSAAISAS